MIENASDVRELEAAARRVRGKVIEMSCRAGTAHLASSLSCVDILVAAYWGILRIDPKDPRSPDRDRLILSKGHAISSLYAVLAYRGFFPVERLERYNQPGSGLPEQPSPGCVPGLEAATGSLGHGLPLGAGMALAARILGRSYRVFVVMSDGECNEGSVWEAAMFAAGRGLGNVTVVVDYNKWQATDRSEAVMALKPLRQKWESFGWSASEADGHDVGALVRSLSRLPEPGKPTAIIAHTVKGKGVSFMEDDNNWHYQSPSRAQLKEALKELGLA
ncbi:MAG: transketolase [Elusimicrobia bacterium]|nr:transketolase [Elusimicrobiota bacterium]